MRCAPLPWLLLFTACAVGLPDGGTPSTSPTEPPQAAVPETGVEESGESGPSDVALAHDFELEAVDGRRWSLTDALAAGPVVLVFYRGHW